MGRISKKVKIRREIMKKRHPELLQKRIEVMKKRKEAGNKKEESDKASHRHQRQPPPSLPPPHSLPPLHSLPPPPLRMPIQNMTGAQRAGAFGRKQSTRTP
ncbi:hypothetical protein Pcinc_015975 [Petrolisthes cinctipes]|uniref:Uncharacterized protein n=1 Tax=Petrolisthes cinctipes TaxID=88211 RepID=A0AAE1KQ62_PETCI|nr:hypothetical protein Pcinc_015975 [Petrolisthes cinctipes]